MYYYKQACLVVATLLLVGLRAFSNPVWEGAAWGVASPKPAEINAVLAETASIRELSLDQLFELGVNEKKIISHNRPESEQTVWKLAQLYRLTGDESYAEQAVAIMQGLAARSFPSLPEGIHTEGKWLPYTAIIAFGIINELGYWDVEDGVDVNIGKVALEAWLNEYRVSFRELLQRPEQVTNYTPFGLRHAAVLGLVLHDGDLMELCYQTAHQIAFSPEFWHADLIWQEGTVSYARQVTGNLRALLPMLAVGEALDGVTYGEANLEDLSQRLAKIDQAQADFRMPSGRPIPVNDTHWSIPSDSTPRGPRAVAFPDFGHFALPGADLETHLSVPTLTGGGRYGGGHYHDSRLSMQLWAHGQEVLPDAGYPFQPANNRYFHMSPLAHNTSIVKSDAPIERDAGAYGVWGGSWARSALLAYEDGSASDGLVSYIAASSPGPSEEHVQLSERMLIQVSTGPWSGYVIDAFWLQGGTIHQSFLRQSEDELVDQTVSAPLIDAGKTMADVLKDSSGNVDQNWSRHLRDPKRIDTGAAIQLSWSGVESGVSLNTYLAPQLGSTSWISQLPRLRPTQQDPAKRDDFPGWHVTRQRKVEPDQITLWAAVYEPVGIGQNPKISTVTWEKSEGSLLLKVDQGERVDTWMLSLPDQDSEIGEYTLVGRAAGFSSQQGQTTWRWAGLDSSLKHQGETVISVAAPDPLKVFRLTQAGGAYELVVSGAMERPVSGWAALQFADGSGRAIQLGAMRQQDCRETVFEILEDPGMEIDATGLTRTAFPLLEIEGPVFIRPLGAKFMSAPEGD